MDLGGTRTLRLARVLDRSAATVDEGEPLRSLLAVALGFAAMTVAVIASTIVLAEILYPNDPAGTGPAPAGWLIVNFASSFAAAALGGWLAARLAPRAPYGHAIALAAVAVALSLPGVVRGAAPGQPAWYPTVLGVVAVAGILTGGRLYRGRPGAS